jgi:hypothetical protein
MTITPDILDKAKRKTPAELIRKAKQPSEKEFQKQVIALAKLCGWMVAHFRASMNARGEYQTAVAADGAGFPDLVLSKVGRPVLFVELKTDTGKVSAAQQEWYNRLFLSGADVRLWRPAIWPAIVRTLKGET